MAGPLKASTGLAGLAVAQYPHKMLTVIYQKILKTIKEMPEDYTYRKTTQVTQLFLNTVQAVQYNNVNSNAPFPQRYYWERLN